MAASRATGRAVFIGLFLVVFIAVGEPYTRYLLRNTPFAFTALPWGILAVFGFVCLVLNPLLARLRPTWRVQPNDLGLAFIMGVTAGSIAGVGYVGVMLAVSSAPLYYATPENRWAETFFRYLPSYLTPFANRHAVDWFYDGLPPGEGIPWGAWGMPVFWWTSFTAALMVVLYGLTTIFRRHWVEHERLPFPIIQVPLAMAQAPEPGRMWPPLLRGKRFWWGFAISGAWLSVNTLHNFWPLLPHMPTEWPSLQFGPEFPPLPVKVFFPIVGVSYFAPTEILFSMWMWMLLGALYTGFSRRLGVAASLATDAMDWVSTGAMTVFVAITLWMARRHLATVVRSALSAGRTNEDADEPVSYRMACMFVLGGLVYMVVFLMRMGMSLFTVLVFLTMVLVVYLGLSRLTFEGGILYMSTPLDPAAFTATAFGSQNIHPAGLTALALSYSEFSTTKATELNAMGHALALSDRLAYRRRELNWALPLALLVGIGVAVWYTVRMGYTYGAFNIDNWVFKGAAAEPYEALMRQLTTQEGPSAERLGLFCGGGLLVAVVSFLRYSIPGWPLHPIGLMVCFTYHTRHSAFSLFLTWLAKSLILRWGGISAYRRGTPFFLGLLLGAISASFVSFVCDVIWFPMAGHSILYW